jgi:hypothetical protein
MRTDAATAHSELETRRRIGDGRIDAERSFL